MMSNGQKKSARALNRRRDSQQPISVLGQYQRDKPQRTLDEKLFILLKKEPLPIKKISEYLDQCSETELASIYLKAAKAGLLTKSSSALFKVRMPRSIESEQIYEQGVI